jgi:hypothetical protein
MFTYVQFKFLNIYLRWLQNSYLQPHRRVANISFIFFFKKLPLSSSQSYLHTFCEQRSTKARAAAATGYESFAHSLSEFDEFFAGGLLRRVTRAGGLPWTFLCHGTACSLGHSVICLSLTCAHY